MFVWRIRAALPGLLVAALASASHAQYTTDWLANTFGTLAAHIGNGARSMWVAPEGVIYTSSRWDENAGGVANAVNASPNAHVGTVAVAVRYPPNCNLSDDDFFPSPVM